MNRIGLASALLLAGCASGPTPRQQANQWALANARPVGQAETCIQVSRIRDSDVRDDRTIDFTLVGGQVMRSRLPYACPGLAFEERIAYRTSIGRLCAVDTVTVVRSDGSPGASCGLGPFQEVEIARR